MRPRQSPQLLALRAAPIRQERAETVSAVEAGGIRAA